ncbi:MAG: hypothetical protein GQ542_13895 [Desulforhopalus sp.]|nr:hypothetical protein [Desulforhopalus sp.]
MREHLIEQLRRLSRVKGKQATWISQLGDDEIYELFLRLRSGETAKSIARYVQHAWGVNPNSSVHSISQGILKFKKRIAHLLLTPPSVSNSPLVNLEETSQLEGLEGMERIAQLQLARIERMINEEQETGIKHTSLSRELQALSTIMKCQMKLKEWYILHEGNDPVRRRRLERMKRRFEEPFRALMDSIDEEGRNRLLEASSKLLEDLERYAVEAEVAPDGKLQLVKPDESPQR